MTVPVVDISALMDRIEADPLVIAELDRIQREGESYRVTTPHQVLGHRGVVCATMLTGGYTVDPEMANNPGFARFAEMVYADSIAFMVEPKIWNVVVDMPLPRHVIGRMPLPAPLMYVYIGHSAIILTTTGEDQGINIVPVRDGTVMTTSIRFGSRYPDDVHAGSLQEEILKLLAFINSPYTETHKTKGTRPERRRLLKEGFSYEPEVHVVKLRAAVKTPSSEEIARVGGSANWQHRWWVRGHFRAQWYPSQEAHQVVWIAPFIKGPEDKPFKSAVYAVVR